MRRNPSGVGLAAHRETAARARGGFGSGPPAGGTRRKKRLQNLFAGRRAFQPEGRLGEFAAQVSRPAAGALFLAPVRPAARVRQPADPRGNPQGQPGYFARRLRLPEAGKVDLHALPEAGGPLLHRHRRHGGFLGGKSFTGTGLGCPDWLGVGLPGAPGAASARGALHERRVVFGAANPAREPGHRGGQRRRKDGTGSDSHVRRARNHQLVWRADIGPCGGFAHALLQELVCDRSVEGDERGQPRPGDHAACDQKGVVGECGRMLSGPIPRGAVGGGGDAS